MTTVVEAERIVTGAPTGEDEAVDCAIRPRTLADYVGQAPVKAQLAFQHSGIRSLEFT